MVIKNGENKITPAVAAAAAVGGAEGPVGGPAGSADLAGGATADLDRNRVQGLGYGNNE